MAFCLADISGQGALLHNYLTWNWAVPPGPDHLLLGFVFSPSYVCNWSITLSMCGTPQKRVTGFQLVSSSSTV